MEIKIKVSRPQKEAIAFDEENRNTFWQDAKILENKYYYLRLVLIFPTTANLFLDTPNHLAIS